MAGRGIALPTPSILTHPSASASHTPTTQMVWYGMVWYGFWWNLNSKAGFWFVGSSRVMKKSIIALLYCIVLYCILLYYIVLYNIISYSPMAAYNANNNNTAANTLRFLQGFYQKYPQFANNPLYITGMALNWFVLYCIVLYFMISYGSSTYTDPRWVVWRRLRASACIWNPH